MEFSCFVVRNNYTTATRAVYTKEEDAYNHCEKVNNDSIKRGGPKDLLTYYRDTYSESRLCSAIRRLINMEHGIEDER